MLSSVFNRNLYSFDSIEELPVDNVHRSLGNDHIACIRGLFKTESIKAATKSIAENFSHQNDNPTSDNPPGFTRCNFQKLRVGTLADRPEVARLLRTFYNPLWADDIHDMHEIFRSLANVRNLILGKPVNFAVDMEEDGLWTSSRIHQYPVGGGFMSSHRDLSASSVAERHGLPYLQMLLYLSEKGIDYERGGAYLEHADGRIAVDDYCRMGDVLIYDGATVHGVEEIDPHKRLDLDSFNGRVVAFANLWGHI
jgi:hypothetical protein